MLWIDLLQRAIAISRVRAVIGEPVGLGLDCLVTILVTFAREQVKFPVRRQELRVEIGLRHKRSLQGLPIGQGQRRRRPHVLAAQDCLGPRWPHGPLPRKSASRHRRIGTGQASQFSEHGGQIIAGKLKRRHRCPGPALGDHCAHFGVRVIPDERQNRRPTAAVRVRSVTGGASRVKRFGRRSRRLLGERR